MPRNRTKPLGRRCAAVCSLCIFIVVAVAYTAGTAMGQSRDPGSSQAAPTHLDLFGDPLPKNVIARCGTIRFRYPESRLFQFLPDGRAFLVAERGQIRWIDADSGKTLTTRVLPAGLSVYGFSPDGQFAVVGRGFGAPQPNNGAEPVMSLQRWSLSLWDIRAWRVRCQLQGAPALDNWPLLFGKPYVSANCRFNAQCTLVAVSLHQVTINIGTGVWATKDGRKLWEPPGDEPLLGFQPGGKTLALLAPNLDAINLCDALTGRALRQFKISGDYRVFRLLTSPDGKTFLIATQTGRWRTWDIATGRELPALQGHDNLMYECLLSLDGHTLVTGGHDRELLVWDWPAGKLKSRIDLGAGRELSPELISPDGRRMEICVRGEVAWRRMNLVTAKEMPRTYAAHAGPVLAMAIRPDGRLVSADGMGTARIWELQSGRQVEVQQHEFLKDSDLEQHGGICLRADGLVAIASEERGKIRVADVATRRVASEIDMPKGSFFGMALCPANRLLAVCWQEANTSPPYLHLWDIDHHKELRRIETRYGTPAFSPDGSLVACAREVHPVVLDVKTGGERDVLGIGKASSFAFSPDGRTLAVADERGFGLWELSTGSWLRRVEKPAGENSPLSFSPDGRWLARADGWDIQLFEVATGRQVAYLAGHTGAITQFAFTADGKRLVSASRDTTMLVWDLNAVTR